MSVKYTVEPLTMSHAAYIARHMRDQDRSEMAALGHSPEVVVSSALGSELAFCATADGVPFYIFGMSRSTVLASTGRVWGMGTEEIKKHVRVFFPNSVQFIKFCKQRASELESDVDLRNTLSVRWLRRLGFAFDDPRPVGINGELFSRISMRGDLYV